MIKTPPLKQHPMPFTRIELAILSIIDDQLMVLIGRRTSEPYSGKWALPGGVLRIDLDADLDAAAQRVASERIGTPVPYLRQLTAVGSAGRDSRAPWALSIAYRALIPIDSISPQAGKRLDELKWIPAEEASLDSELAFDHASLIGVALEATRSGIDRLELPFGFLPERFTLGELQACCEVLLGRRLDKSSFRRRIDERNLVEPVPGEMRTGAFRPAQLFRRRC